MLASTKNVSELRLSAGASCEHAHLLHDPSPIAHRPSPPLSDSSCIPPESPCGREIDDYTRNFDCNLCMQTCQEPVATMCGHLFCWPCLYHHSYLSLHPTSCKACPVCKADIQDKLVPLYGCGRIRSVTEKFDGVQIPPRPAANACSAPSPQSKLQHAMQHIPSLHAGGLLSTRRQRAAALLVMRRRRFNNEKEFLCHWVFIIMASFTIVFFLSC